MDKSLQNPKCSICNTDLIGSFCYNCGQKATFKKVTVKDALKALLSGIFSIERGILGTLKSLTVKPKFIIENYLAGNRLYYFSPGQMIFYAIFIIGLHLAFVSNRILGFNVSLQGLSGGIKTILTPQFLFIILILPLYTLTTYLSYIKIKKSLIEHFAANVYLFSYSIIVCTVIGDLAYLVIGLSLNYTTPLFLAFLFIWSSRVYTKSRKWNIFLLSTFTQIVMFIAIIGLLVLVAYLIDPETIKVK